MKEHSTILLAEDNADDAFLIRRGLEKLGFGGALQIVEDGQAALRYLKSQAPYNDALRYPVPDMVITDSLHGPMTGLHVLEWIRSDPALQHILLIFYSGSVAPKDVQRIKALGADAYFLKSVNFQETLQQLHEIVDYLPQRSSR